MQLQRSSHTYSIITNLGIETTSTYRIPVDPGYFPLNFGAENVQEMSRSLLKSAVNSILSSWPSHAWIIDGKNVLQTQ